MENPMIFYPFNYCRNCKRNTIEIYSWQNYIQHYDKVIEQYKSDGTLPDHMNKYPIFTMRCRTCGKEYHIYWDDNGNFPRPMLNNDHQNKIFMGMFKDESIKGRPKIITNIYKERMGP